MRTLRQLYRLHAIAITNGLISSHPHLTLPKLLYPFTLLLAGPTSSPPPWTAYVSSLFNSIDEPSSFGYNTGVRAPRFSPPPLAPSTCSLTCLEGDRPRLTSTLSLLPSRPAVSFGTSLRLIPFTSSP
ncbi:hypothetical protein CDL15_Pgr015357 [Punica granatum]|uniref:Uncharacterized protein n=1 Tax=Punica granatum TaxID=22663 RepID=A0A218W1C8_PUNGR|nr:hypothetical protein CDL15_Pgr015357 [Punica granatum]